MFLGSLDLQFLDQTLTLTMLLVQFPVPPTYYLIQQFLTMILISWDNRDSERREMQLLPLQPFGSMIRWYFHILFSTCWIPFPVCELFLSSKK